MPEVGSPAWIDAFAAAVATVDPGDAEVSVLHRIVDGPSWLLRTGDGRVAVEAASPDADADITFTWQRDDAEAVARGELGPLVPFQAGRLRVGGDLTLLTEVAALFAQFPAVTVGA